MKRFFQRKREKEEEDFVDMTSQQARDQEHEHEHEHEQEQEQDHEVEQEVPKSGEHQQHHEQLHPQQPQVSELEEGDEEDEEQEKDTLQSLHRSSLFSNRRTLDTFSTTPTSLGSSSSRKSKGRYSSIDNMGKPLRVMPADKYNELSLSRTSTSASGSQPLLNFGIPTLHEQPGAKDEEVERSLEVLTESLVELVDQVQQSVSNVSKASIRLVELLDSSMPFKISSNLSWKIEESSLVRNIVKVCLQFHDTYLRGDVYTESRALVKRSLTELLNKLNFSPVCEGYDTVPFFRNFAISESEPYPVQHKLSMIIDRILESSSALSDQEGSFIAPILRGLSKQTAVLSIMFGFPDPQQEHYEIINALFQTFSDVHFFVGKNFISPAATKFTPPFRVPTKNSPEISISISSSDAIKTSGTLGGYITPKIGRTTDKALLQYKGSKFAITCAHVLLGEDQDYPQVQVPSSVLLNAYKSVLVDEMDKYPLKSPEQESYASELSRCDDYSLNLGSVIWGERVVLDHVLSDVAIVKLNESIPSPQNSLGDDADQFAPSLKFSNQIKRVVQRSEFNTHTKVFKVGASTKYTSGVLNGLKMVYWLRGALQTSEFVVGSGEPMFCNGGDSGALILNNLERERGLGCVGLLHSYDGEGKQFGLFTPMDSVMARLKEVTGVEWGFV